MKRSMWDLQPRNSDRAERSEKRTPSGFCEYLRPLGGNIAPGAMGYEEADWTHVHKLVSGTNTAIAGEWAARRDRQAGRNVFLLTHPASSPLPGLSIVDGNKITASKRQAWFSEWITVPVSESSRQKDGLEMRVNSLATRANVFAIVILSINSWSGFFTIPLETQLSPAQISLCFPEQNQFSVLL